MIPGSFAIIGGSVPNEQMIQYARATYNAGYVSSGSMTLDIATQMPFVSAGDLMRIDGLWWQGSWCTNWKDRVAFYFKYGTAYDSGQINGGGSKNHRIRFVYAGGQTATVSHSYSGDSTDFPRAEVSIDRLYWFDTTVGSSNYYVSQLPA